VELGLGQHTRFVAPLQTDYSLLGVSLSMRLLSIQYNLLELLRELSLLAILALLPLFANQVTNAFNTPRQLGLLANFLFGTEIAEH